MKKFLEEYLNPDFILGALWFCVVQPALFFMTIAMFVTVFSELL